jgi:hypothetical protein
MTPQKANNQTTEDFMESGEDKYPVADIRKMIIRMFIELKEELKEDIQKLSESHENTDKKTQKDTETTYQLQGISTNSKTKQWRLFIKI